MPTRSTRTFAMTLAAAIAFCTTLANAAPIPISSLLSDIQFNIAAGQPIPEGLFDTTGPFPFSNVTVNGQDTEALVYLQEISVDRQGNANVAGITGPVPQSIDVTESASQFLYDERPEGVYELPNGAEPLDNSELVAGGMLPSTMTLTLVDADPSDADPFTPFFNDALAELPPNTAIAVYTGPPVPIEIVALDLVSSNPIVVASNSMIPFQFFADDGSGNILDNAFGVFEMDWNVPDVNVELDGMGTDGVSPFLQNWPDPRQYRWKPHPGGWARVQIGTASGPAAMLHLPDPDVPEPATAMLTLLAMTAAARRRSRR